MNYLFSKTSLMILESLSFTKTLYAFDYDGTLSRIVQTPQKASTTTEVCHLMNQLSKLTTIAVVSGRSLSDLKERLTFKAHHIIGNHGLEGINKVNVSLKKAVDSTDIWRKELANIKFGTGIEIEDKSYSLAIHYRKSRSKKIARDQIYRAISELSSEPKVIAGKSVVNILPINAPHKGMAVLELMKNTGCTHAFYIGDDDTDEDVFSLPNSKIMTVRVGFKKSSNAQFYIEKQTQIKEVLKKLIQYNQRNQ